MSDCTEIDYTVSSHYLPAIINDDFTGLDEGEVLELTTFLDNISGCSHAWCVKEQDAELATCEISGLYSECEILTLIIVAH